MFDDDVAQLALRNRAITLVAATTGSATLSATSLGFARGSGSFLTDGFRAGMEVKATGFGANNNLPRIVTGVTAMFITAPDTTVESATAGRAIIAGLPSRRAWENVEFVPTTDQLYISEQYVPGPRSLIAGPKEGGHHEVTGIYFLTIQGLPRTGTAGIRRYANTLLALFAPGTIITAGSEKIHIRGDVAPKPGQIMPLDNGRAICTVEIPWRCANVNSVAA